MAVTVISKLLDWRKKRRHFCVDLGLCRIKRLASLTTPPSRLMKIHLNNNCVARESPFISSLLFFSVQNCVVYLLIININFLLMSLFQSRGVILSDYNTERRVCMCVCAWCERLCYYELWATLITVGFEENLLLK